MVVRIYRATPKQEKLKEYEKLLVEQALPLVRKAKGCMEGKVLKSLGVVREIVLITVWDSLESVKAFVGENWNEAYLVGKELDMVEGKPDVKHYHQVAAF